MPRRPTQAETDAADELIRKSNVVRFVKEWVRDLQRLTRLKADLERIIGRPMPRQGDRASWTELAAEHDVPGECKDWAAIAAWIVGAHRRGKAGGDNKRPRSRLVVDPHGRSVKWKGRRIKVNGSGDYGLLAALVNAPSGYVSFAGLLRAVKPDEVGDLVDLDEAPPEVRVGMTRLRAALKAVDCPWRIRVERGKGYRLVDPV